MRIAEDLRRSVLQAAIEGRLTGGGCEGWRYVRLGEISLSIQYGYNAPAREKGSVKMVRISDIQNSNIQWDNVPYCEISEDEIPKYLLAKNDILFARTGSVGKSYLVGDLPEKAIYAGYLIRVRISDEINPQYVKYFMESESYWRQIRKGTTKTVQPNCNGKTLSQIIIPLPPIEEQRRIVSRLDSLLPLIAELEAAETELEALERSFPGDMRDSLLQAAIQGKLTGSNTDNWRWVRLGEIGDIIGGGTPDTSIAEYWLHGKIAWITPADMSKLKSKYISHGARYITEKGLASSSARIMPKGSIIFSSRAPIGYIAIAENDLCTNQGCKSVRLHDENLPEYVYFALLAMRDDIKKMGSGTTFKEISGRVFSSVIIPLPPIKEQHKIVARLNELLPLCEALEEIIFD